MKELEKLYQPETKIAISDSGVISPVIERMHATALAGESFEDASVALESVEAFQNFREEVSKLPFASFHEIVEEVTNLNKLPLSREERKEQIEILIEKLEQRAIRFSPRVADLYLAILNEIKGESYEPKFAGKPNDIDIKAKIDELKEKEESGFSDFDILFSGEFSWEMKLNRIETRLIDYLKGARAFDKQEGKEMDEDIRKWRENELKKALTRPSERRNESKPGVDPMKRLKEGERVPAIWSIELAYNGYCRYYKTQSFSEWDNKENKWKESEYIYDDVKLIPLSNNQDEKKGHIDLIANAKILANQWTELSAPYTHDVHKIEANGRNCKVKKDQNGDIVVLVEGENNEEIEISVILAPNPNKKFTSDAEQIKVPEMFSEFSEETNNKIEEIKNKKRGNIARATAIRSYILSNIQYLAPKDRVEADRYNNIYRTDKKGFAGAVDEIKKGDCDVVNTYFAALCAKLNIPVRHCVGHSVSVNEQGFLIANSGTGHGWSEVWDERKKEWILFDATPAGDPNLEENEEQSGKRKYVPDNYGIAPAVRPTDERLEKLRKKLAEHKEKLSYTKEERQLAEGAGIELKEAREIVIEINKAERVRLPNGELVKDALTCLFNAIVELRKTTASVYDGPVRKREGGEGIEDIVGHKVGILAGQSDPLSREKIEQETKQEKLFGGFDLYMIGDKSGSMQGTTEKLEHLWQMQRQAIYLIFSSLYYFERDLRIAGLQKENTLSTRTQCISFRGDDLEKDIDLDKPLSGDFTAKDKVKLWHSLTQQGIGSGEVTALTYIYGQIKSEIEETEKHGAKDNRLRLVIVCSDGEFKDEVAKKVQQLAEELGKLNAVVVGIGLTETAAAVPIIYNTNYSRGDIAYNINDLPALVAKHIVFEAIKLFPEKARESAKQIIELSIAKFKNIK